MSALEMAKGYRVAAGLASQLRFLPDIERAAAALFSATDLPEALRNDATPLDVLREAQQSQRLWVALAPDEKPVGFVYAVVLDGLPHLQELSVDPHHGRRGIGTSLVHTVCEWAHRTGARAVTLTTFRHVAWNAPFYERLGFRILSRDDLGPGLAETLRKEAEEGLDAAMRVAMRLELCNG